MGNGMSVLTHRVRDGIQSSRIIFNIFVGSLQLLDIRLVKLVTSGWVRFRLRLDYLLVLPISEEILWSDLRIVWRSLIILSFAWPLSPPKEKGRFSVLVSFDGYRMRTHFSSSSCSCRITQLIHIVGEEGWG